jgi:hypothetical protein
MAAVIVSIIGGWFGLSAVFCLAISIAASKFNQRNSEIDQKHYERLVQRWKLSQAGSKP